LSAEQILTKTCADAVSDGPRDVLSESDDDNIENKSYSDFEPKIARKINCTICLVTQKVGVPSKKTAMVKVTFFADWEGGGCCDKARTIHYSIL
jgi:hypothetical protein